MKAKLMRIFGIITVVVCVLGIVAVFCGIIGSAVIGCNTLFLKTVQMYGVCSFIGSGVLWGIVQEIFGYKKLATIVILLLCTMFASAQERKDTIELSVNIGIETACNYLLETKQAENIDIDSFFIKETILLNKETYKDRKVSILEIREIVKITFNQTLDYILLNNKDINTISVDIVDMCRKQYNAIELTFKNIQDEK